MANIKRGNWSFKDPGDDVPSNSTIYGGNFSQLTPSTEILKGKTLTIHGGNFTNVKIQPEWTVIGGNFCQVSRCSHEHPEWVARGLPECAEDCIHRVGAEKQWVNVEEQEYREEKNSLSAEKAVVKVINSTDADNIITQKLQKEVYVYQDCEPPKEQPKEIK